MAKKKDKTKLPRVTGNQEPNATHRVAAMPGPKTILRSETANRLAFTQRDTLAVLALAALVTASYFPALLAGFFWDDHVTFIKAQPVREGLSGLRQIWLSPSSIHDERHYWPLTYTSFWLEHKLWGLDPTGYHAVSLLLHFANSTLVLLLLRQLAVPGAWLAAALFAAHPVHVEPVSSIISRKDLLYTLFCLCAMLIWSRSVLPMTNTGNAATLLRIVSSGPYLAALVLYVAAMLSKSMAVSLPLALLIGQWLMQGRIVLHDLLRLLPFFGIGFGVTLGDFLYYNSGEADPFFDHSPGERLLLAAQALCFYLGKLLWPTEFIPIYPHWETGSANPLAWLCLLGIATVFATLLALRQRIGRGPLAGLLFFAVTLTPVLGFVEYGHMRISFVADRYQYLASLGPLALFAATAHRLILRLKRGSCWTMAGLTTVLLVTLGTLSWRQTNLYRDEVGLWTYIITRNPTAYEAHHNLATVLMAAKRHEEALEAARTAMRMRPDSPLIHAMVGTILIELERLEEAEQVLREGLRHRPDKLEINNSLGTALLLQGRHEESLTYFRTAIRQAPYMEQAYVGLGKALLALKRHQAAYEVLKRGLDAARGTPVEAGMNALLGQAMDGMGQPGLAARHLEQGLRENPGHPETLAAMANLQLNRGAHAEALKLLSRLAAIAPDPSVQLGTGKALFSLERYPEARAALEQGLALEPEAKVATELHTLLGRCLLVMEDAETAAQHFQQALQVDPLHAEALLGLGNLHMATGRYQEALALLQRLADIHPDNASVHGGIGIALARLGRNTESLKHLDLALSLDPSAQVLQAERERIHQEMTPGKH